MSFEQPWWEAYKQKAPKVGDVFEKDGLRYIVTESTSVTEEDGYRETWNYWEVTYRRLVGDQAIGKERRDVIHRLEEMPEYKIVEHRIKDEHWLPQESFAF